MAPADRAWVRHLAAALLLKLLLLVLLWAAFVRGVHRPLQPSDVAAHLAAPAAPQQGERK